MLHVFVDEAGVPGFTSHFIIGFAFFPNENYKLCVDNIKSKITTVKGKVPRELHFHDINPELKKEFLQQLVEVDGRFGYIHIEKDLINEEFREHPNNNLM